MELTSQQLGKKNHKDDFEDLMIVEPASQRVFFCIRQASQRRVEDSLDPSAWRQD